MNSAMASPGMTLRVSVFRTSMSSVSRRSSPEFVLSFIRTLQRQLSALIIQRDGTPLVEDIVAENAIDLLPERCLERFEALRQDCVLADFLAVKVCSTERWIRSELTIVSLAVSITNVCGTPFTKTRSDAMRTLKVTGAATPAHEPPRAARVHSPLKTRPAPPGQVPV